MRKLFGLPKLESENFRVNNDYVFLYRILRKILMIENYLYDVKRGGQDRGKVIPTLCGKRCLKECP